jgi:hypothetical protein
MSTGKILLLISCFLIILFYFKRSPAAEHDAIYVVPSCDYSENDDGLMRERKSVFFGPNLPKKICTGSVSLAARLYPKIRLKRSAVSGFDIEFACNKIEFTNFLQKNSGKKVLFLSKGKVIGSALMEKPFGSNPCALRGFESLAEATGACEVFGKALGLPIHNCYNVCESTDDSWACVSVSLGVNSKNIPKR